MTSLPSPPPLRARQEKFCQAYVADPHATRAALLAGYAPRTARVQGSRLLSDARVAARIRALQGAVAARMCVNVDALMAKLEAVYLKALDGRNFHAAGKAVEMQARLAGLAAARPADAPDDG